MCPWLYGCVLCEVKERDIPSDDLVDIDSDFFALKVPFAIAHELVVFGHIDLSDGFLAFAYYIFKAVKIFEGLTAK